MNRNYKVIWNTSLNCFMAVAEYAKSRGKSSGGAVTSSTKVSSGSVVANSVNILRWSAVCTGLIAAGFSMQASAACTAGTTSFNCGSGSSAGTSGVAIGQNATASANQAIAIGGVDGGQFTTASGDQSIALGANVVSSGSSSIAIGGDDLNQASRTNVDENGIVTSTGTDNNSGNVNTAFKKYSGRDLVGSPQYPNTAASGQASVAIGVQSVSSGALSTAFGTQTKASGIASAAFGVSANASKEGSVAIGAGSQTDGSATKVTKQTVNGVEFTGFIGNSSFAGTAADAGRQVSVGLIGNERQIKNVAPGELSATSTDAINGSQIYAVSSKLIDNINAVKTTTDAVVAGTAGLVKQANGTAPITVGAQTGGTSVSFANSANVDRQLKGVAAGTDTNDAVNVGQLNTLKNQTFKIQANNDTASTVKSSDTVKFIDGKNINITRTGNNITVGTANDLTATSVTTGDAKLNTAGLTITAADPANNVVLSSTGLNNGNNKITNVAAGTLSDDSLDAVNGSQLNATNKNVTANTTNITKNTGAIATNAGNITNLTEGKTGIVRQNADTGAITVGGQTAGSSVSFANSTGGTRILTGVTAGSADTDAVNFSQLKTVSAKADNSVQYDQAGKTSITLGGGATGTTITNVKAGALSDDSLDAVNGSQLNTTNKNVTKNTGDIATNAGNITKAKTTVTAGDNVVVTKGENTDGSANYVVKTKDDLALTSVTTGDAKLNTAGLTITAADPANNVVLSSTGLNNGNNKITNVAAGTDDADAVNVSQLQAVSTVANNSVQYDRNKDGTVNYDRIIAGNGKGTPVVIKKNADDEFVVVSGGTVISNVANGVNADDAINKGQLDGIVANNITDVEIKDQNGNVIDVKNVTQNVVNTKFSTDYEDNKESLFLTYNKEGQKVTDRLTIGETVQKMNTEGVKFAHTNPSAQSKGDIASGVTNDSSAGGFDSTAIGVNAIITEKGVSSVALGHNTKVDGASSIAIGDGAQALGKQSISIGTRNEVNGNYSGAFGDPSIIDGDNSYSVGNHNTVVTDNTFVLGNNVTETVEGSVILGNESGTTTKGGVIGYLADVNNLILATTSNRGAVAVGNASAGIYRQITGVAAGTADSDAVNVSQLKAVNAKIDNIGGSNTTLNDAAVQYDKKDGNIDKGSITLAGTSVSTGIGNNGNTVVTSGGTTITNVANGVKVSDAVNKGQLDSLGGGVAGIIGGSVKYENGQLVVDSSGIGNTGEVTIHDAIASINNGNAQANESIKANTNDIKANAESIKTNANNIKANTDSIKINTDGIKANANRLDAGLSFGADSGNNINKSVGDSTAVKFEGGNNITTTATGSGIKFDLNGDISVDSVTTGNTTINNTGVTIKDGASMTVDGIYAGNKTITGVADGIEVKDAVNFGQLNALDKRLGNSINELGYKINEVEDDANAGISAAMAMSSLPQAYIPGKSMVGGGIATYNGQSAVAVGVSKVSDNGRWVIKANGTADTQGNAGGAIGAGFHF